MTLLRCVNIYHSSLRILSDYSRIIKHTPKVLAFFSQKHRPTRTMSSNEPVVLDNGTGYVKCGFASAEESPPIVFPSCVGRRVVRFEEALHNSSLSSSPNNGLVVVGQDCIDNRQNYEVSYPIKNGIVTSWPDMILVWEHAIYDELKLTRERLASGRFCSPRRLKIR